MLTVEFERNEVEITADGGLSKRRGFPVGLRPGAHVCISLLAGCSLCAVHLSQGRAGHPCAPCTFPGVARVVHGARRSGAQVHRTPRCPLGTSALSFMPSQQRLALFSTPCRPSRLPNFDSFVKGHGAQRLQAANRLMYSLYGPTFQKTSHCPKR